MSSALASFSTAGGSQAASIAATRPQATLDKFGPLVGSGFFDIILGDLGNGDVLSTWVRSTQNFTINGEEYWFKGDFHTAVTGEEAVPEPATVALLGLGLIGAGFRRRKQA